MKLMVLQNRTCVNEAPTRYMVYAVRRISVRNGVRPHAAAVLAPRRVRLISDFLIPLNEHCKKKNKEYRRTCNTSMSIGQNFNVLSFDHVISWNSSESDIQ